MFVDELFSHDEDEMTIRSINNNYDYINMQFHWRNKTRLKCIKKIKKNFNKNLLFLSKRRQNIIADCHYASFHECGCQISKVKIPESELRCLPGVLLYFKQSGNHAHALTPHIITAPQSVIIYNQSANIHPVYSDWALSSSLSLQDMPLTADWLQVCFGTRPKTVVKSFSNIA